MFQVHLVLLFLSIPQGALVPFRGVGCLVTKTWVVGVVTVSGALCPLAFPVDVARKYVCVRIHTQRHTLRHTSGVLPFYILNTMPSDQCFQSQPSTTGLTPPQSRFVPAFPPVRALGPTLSTSLLTFTVSCATIPGSSRLLRLHSLAAIQNLPTTANYFIRTCPAAF